MRKALVVGIDHYAYLPPLYGCTHDARAVQAVLGRHADGTLNFAVQLLVAPDARNAVTREVLRARVRELFAHDGEIALLYFAGHGHAEATGGYLCASDSRASEAVLALGEVLTLANRSRARHRVIVLDSCHAGLAGASPLTPHVAELSEDLTVLAAATAEQYATEEDGRGLFTSLLVDALAGAAANLLGDVTPGSVYAHVDQALGPWEQRPVFKTHVKGFISLRRAAPPLALADLLRIPEFFPAAGADFPLDPSFEPEGPAPDPENAARFAVLQRYHRVNLVIPVDAPHMWHAAMQGKRCRLTPLGEHYRRLAASGRI